MSRTLEDLELVFQRLEAVDAITNVAQQFAMACDDRAFEKLTSLLTPGAIWDYGPQGVVEGADAVVDALRARLGRMTMTIHRLFGFHIVMAGKSANAVIGYQAEVVVDGTAVLAAGRYVDSYEQHNGAWRLGRRKADLIYAMPFAELALGLPSPLRRRWPGSAPSMADLGINGEPSS